jgi:hypothetical protein
MEDELRTRLEQIMAEVVAKEEAKKAREAAWQTGIQEAIRPALEELKAGLDKQGYYVELSKRVIHMKVWRGKHSDLQMPVQAQQAWPAGA